MEAGTTLCSSPLPPVLSLGRLPLLPRSAALLLNHLPGLTAALVSLLDYVARYVLGAKPKRYGRSQGYSPEDDQERRCSKLHSYP